MRDEAHTTIVQKLDLENLHLREKVKVGMEVQDDRFPGLLARIDASDAVDRYRNVALGFPSLGIGEE